MNIKEIEDGLEVDEYEDFFFNQTKWLVNRVKKIEEKLAVGITALEFYKDSHDSSCCIAYENNCDCSAPREATEALIKIKGE
jgi:hypothetical protein